MKLADFVNPKDLPEGKNIVEYLVAETDGGLDYTYDATGVVSLLQRQLRDHHLSDLPSRS